MYRRESGVSPEVFAKGGGVGRRGEDAVHLSLSRAVSNGADPGVSSSSLSNAYATPTKLPRREPEPANGLCALCERSPRLACASRVEGVSYAVLPTASFRTTPSASTSRVDAGDDERRSHDAFIHARVGEPRRAAVAVLLPRAHASPRALRSFLRRASLSRSVWILRITSGSTAGLWCAGGRARLGIFELAQRTQVPPLLVLRRGVPATRVPAERRVFLRPTPWSSSAVVRASPAVSSSPAPGRARRGRARLSLRRLHPRRIRTAGQRTSLAASPRRRGAHRSGARLGGARSRVNGDERVTLPR